MLTEFLTAALGTKSMKWETSPAATELEGGVTLLGHLFGLPSNFKGVINDTASTSTLAAIIAAREKILSYQGNKKGLNSLLKLRVYCSKQAHSSIEKAVKIAGLASENLIKVDTDKNICFNSTKTGNGHKR